MDRAQSPFTKRATPSSTKLGYNEKITGSVSELPQFLQSLILIHKDRITSIVSKLPQSLLSLNLVNNEKNTGSVSERPQSFQSLNLGDNEKITGSVSKLPHSLRSLHLRYSRTITGSASKLPQSLQSRPTNDKDAFSSASPWADVPQPTTHVCTDHCWCYTHHKYLLWDPALRRTIGCQF